MRVACLTLLAVLIAAPLAHAAPDTPVGTWRTYDDADGKESGAVTIFERDGMLYGNVTAITDPAKAAAVCSKCTGDRKDQKVLGLQILRGMKRDGNEWDGGEILDPKNGETYRCTMHVEDGGQKLLVRGYLGISLFGRTQTWLRE
jgi:uncharacterized protein (DUF2147 family)